MRLYRFVRLYHVFKVKFFCIFLCAAVLHVQACGVQKLQQNTVQSTYKGTGTPKPPSTKPPVTQPPITKPPVTEPPPPPPVGFLASIPQQYTLMGRFNLQNPNAPIMGWSNSAVGCNFTGTSIRVTLAESSTIDEDGVSADACYNAFIDGNQTPMIIATQPGAHTYPIATNLVPGNHSLWLSKRTEWSDGQTQLINFEIDGNAMYLTPPAHQTRHLEFTGSSTFTGYEADLVFYDPTLGNTSVYNGFAPNIENAAASIPAYTANLLQADFTNISASGSGIYESEYDTSDNPLRLLPNLYAQTLPWQYATLGVANTWTFSQWQANAVIICGGGDDLFNDDSNDGNFINPAGFITAYSNFVTYIRAQYPHALIVCMLMPSAKDQDRITLSTTFERIVATFNTAGDANVVYYDTFANDPNYTCYDDVAAPPPSGLGLGWAGRYHASPAGAQFIAKRLATFLQTKLAW